MEFNGYRMMSLLKEGIFSYRGKYGNKDGRNHFERVNLFFVMAKL